VRHIGTGIIVQAPNKSKGQSCSGWETIGNLTNPHGACMSVRPCQLFKALSEYDITRHCEPPPTNSVESDGIDCCDRIQVCLPSSDAAKAPIESKILHTARGTTPSTPTGHDQLTYGNTSADKAPMPGNDSFIRGQQSADLHCVFNTFETMNRDCHFLCSDLHMKKLKLKFPIG
jgi:hypothetical protein